MRAAALRQSGRIFISYRRQESSGLAGRLYDRLAARFGEDQVFMDVDTIALGVDFTEVIAQAVSTCEVLLAVIGPRWLEATDDNGQRRLDDPDDIVRLEIAAALEQDIPVIPILVEGAAMPRRQELPDALAGLARRNALSLRHESFPSDSDRLLAAIESMLRGKATAPVQAQPSGPPPDVDLRYIAEKIVLQASVWGASPKVYFGDLVDRLGLPAAWNPGDVWTGIADADARRLVKFAVAKGDYPPGTSHSGRTVLGILIQELYLESGDPEMRLRFLSILTHYMLLPPEDIESLRNQ